MQNIDEVRKTATEMAEQARQIGANGETIDPSWVEGWAQVILDCLPRIGKQVRETGKKRKGNRK